MSFDTGQLILNFQLPHHLSLIRATLRNIQTPTAMSSIYGVTFEHVQNQKISEHWKLGRS